MEKYPYLNEAIAAVITRRRDELAISKKKLSEEAMIARAHITALEAGVQSPSMNVVFYLCEALGLEPVDFMRQVFDEIRNLEAEAKKPKVWKA